MVILALQQTIMSDYELSNTIGGMININSGFINAITAFLEFVYEKGKELGQTIREKTRPLIR